MPEEYRLIYRRDGRRLHPFIQEYGETAKSLNGVPVRDMFKWCHDQFGAESKTTWEWYPQMEHRLGHFGFADEAMAFAFKMRWG